MDQHKMALEGKEWRGRPSRAHTSHLEWRHLCKWKKLWQADQTILLALTEEEKLYFYAKQKKLRWNSHLPSNRRWAEDEVVYFCPPETTGSHLYLGASRKCELPIKLTWQCDRWLCLHPNLPCLLQTILLSNIFSVYVSRIAEFLSNLSWRNQKQSFPPFNTREIINQPPALYCLISPSVRWGVAGLDPLTTVHPQRSLSSETIDK